MSQSQTGNYFTPETPDSSAWQQYRCTACDLPKRVAISPSEAPMSVHRICKRCESRQRHRADGGSGRIGVTMIDLTENPNISRAEVLGKLQAGRKVRTCVMEDGEHVHLVAADAVCPRCDDDPLIELDSFGEDVPFFSLLANQKLQRGETYCQPCHDEVTSG